MRLSLNAFLFALSTMLAMDESFGFSFVANQKHLFLPSITSSPTISGKPVSPPQQRTLLYSTPSEESLESISSEDKDQLVGNLVADDEWTGLSMELTEIIRTSVVEDIKNNAQEFLGKDEYKVGDISKEIDARIKDQVAMLRDKDEYELGDLSVALNKIGKDLTCEWTGKDEYEFGDLSNEIDTRLKERVAGMTGKEEYELGDLSTEMDRRVKERVTEFTGKEGYEFGDVANEVETRRKDWIEDLLGKEAADKYEFGDVTKKALANFTGKDEYQFGDVTKKLMGGFFGGKK